MSERRFPICVSPDQVMGLVEIVNSVGGVVDAERINDMTDVDADLLPHAIDAAEMLGLLTFDSGNVKLTEAGRRLAQDNLKSVKRELGERIKRVELFRVLLTVLSEKGRLGKEEASEILRDYAEWGDNNNVDEVFNCLVSWVIYAQVARYDWEEDVLLPRRGLGKKTGGALEPGEDFNPIRVAHDNNIS